jgi:hypothetical protein
MTRWTVGEAEVERLLAARDLEVVRPNDELAHRLLTQATDHIATSRAAVATDPTGAYQLAYDATRKACSAALAMQGLRATRTGGHIAVRVAVVAQFGPARGGRALAKFDVMRRRRQQAEYPDEKADLITPDEAAEAIEWAEQILELVRKATPHLGAW